MSEKQTHARRFDELSDSQRELVRSMDETVRPLLQGSAIVFTVPGDEHFVASGVLVSYRGHRWIATAAHVIEAALERQTRVCWAPLQPGVDYQDAALTELAKAWSASPDGDIAAILLHDGATLEGTRFVGSEQCFQDSHPRPIRDMIWIVGSPVAQRAHDRQAHDLPEAQTQILMHTSAREGCELNPAHSDDDGGRYPREVGLDFHFEWSHASKDGGPYGALFRASGMSGSPVWAAGQVEGAVFPADVRLTAIAWYENTETRCIRAVPFGCWFTAADACLDEYGNLPSD